MESQVIEAFKEEWLSATKNDSFASRMTRQSLEAIALDVPEIGALLTELKKPVQEQLDLHLDGLTVEDHATSASGLGSLYTSLADAVKEISKSITGTARGASRLIAVAPSAGSVRLVLRAPEDLHSPLEGFEMASPDARALRTVAQMMMTAEEDSPTLLAGTQALSRPSRIALRRIAETVTKCSWTVIGELSARDRDSVQIRFSQNGASRLLAAAKATELKSRDVRLRGNLDGWVWSLGVLRFITEEGASFSASVPAPLQPQVARLTAERATGITAIFVKTETFPSGNDRPSRTSYSLADIE